MGLLANKIPNHPLTGSELSAYVRHLAFPSKDIAPERGSNWDDINLAADALMGRMRGDFAFAHNAAYPRPQITVTGKFFVENAVEQPVYKYHLRADFQFINSMMPKHSVEVSGGHERLPDGISGVVTAFERKIRVENPNLVRVHLNLPIQRLVNHAPKPGETLGKAEMVDVQYDPNDYPPLPEPEERDISRETAREWGVAMTKPVYVAEMWPAVPTEPEPEQESDLREKFRARKVAKVEGK